jgi:hypothetical protein
MRLGRVGAFAFCLLLLAGCETGSEQYSRPNSTAAQAVAGEQPGNYFVGRRFYRRYFFFWGYVRQPRQPWSQAQLVMINEQKRHVPDREQNAIGSDNGYEYRLQGYFSGQRVYEPASNSFYPEFVLTGYELISTRPPPIFHDASATDPGRITIDRPE